MILFHIPSFSMFGEGQDIPGAGRGGTSRVKRGRSRGEVRLGERN